MLMDTLSILLLTWNVVTKAPPIEELQDLLQLPSEESLAQQSALTPLPDIYVIGLQEVKSQPQDRLHDLLYQDPWSQTLKSVLGNYGYVKLYTARMVGVVMSVFVQKKHLPYYRDIETALTRTGFSGLWGNKGAVSIRFNIGENSICFVNAHLTHGDSGLNQRIGEYNNIINSQEFSIPDTSNILYHDYVFWMGDLNFRLNEGTFEAEDIVKMLSTNEKSGTNDTALLFEADQLSTIRKKGLAFSEFQEGPVTFPPTYKFEVGGQEYDLKRRPAWTDRILYRVNETVSDGIKLNAKQVYYKSHPELTMSDHKPVSSKFEIKIAPSEFIIPVTFLNMTNWEMGKDGVAHYEVRQRAITSSDWIALFREGFTSLDEYVTYVWAPQEAVEVDGKAVFRVVFPESSLYLPGRYSLLYMSPKAPYSVLGMSDSFQVLGTSWLTNAWFPTAWQYVQQLRLLILILRILFTA